MFTTAGFTLAASVATSGVPGSTGGVAKGAGVCGTESGGERGRGGALAAGAEGEGEGAERG